MEINNILDQFEKVASSPKAQKEKYLSQGEKIVLTVPVYTPEEIIHSMGLVPMGAWGGDLELKNSKKFFPAFICSITQSIVELGMKGTYEGASAIVIPTLCDSLKVLGQNWKYAVPSIPFVPMTYPQQRDIPAGKSFAKAGYLVVIKTLEALTGKTFSEEALSESIAIYNEHNALMRKVSDLLAEHSEISAVQRSHIFKSAYFMKKEEHSELLKAFITSLEGQPKQNSKARVVTTGILSDSPSFLKILDDQKIQIVADDIAHESRQYRTDTPDGEMPLERLAEKFANMGNCSVLFDKSKSRAEYVVNLAKNNKANGVVVAMTKFCDPEEFDYVFVKKACDEAGIPTMTVEVDRQMGDYGQAKTMIEAFNDIIMSNN